MYKIIIIQVLITGEANRMLYRKRAVIEVAGRLIELSSYFENNYI